MRHCARPDHTKKGRNRRNMRTKGHCSVRKKCPSESQLGSGQRGTGTTQQMSQKAATETERCSSKAPKTKPTQEKRNRGGQKEKNRKSTQKQATLRRRGERPPHEANTLTPCFGSSGRPEYLRPGERPPAKWQRYSRPSKAPAKAEPQGGGNVAGANSDPKEGTGSRGTATQARHA